MYYDVTSPSGVLDAVVNRFKELNISLSEAAKRMGYRNRQSLTNLLSRLRKTDSYFTGKQAARFASAFNFNYDYLLHGRGSLEGKQTLPTSSSVIRKFKDLRQTALIEIATNIISYCGNETAFKAWEAINNGDLNKYQDEMKRLIIEYGKVLLPGADSMLVARIASIQNYGELLKVFGTPMDADVIKYLQGKNPLNSDI